MKNPQLHVFVNEIFPRQLFIVKNPTIEYLQANFKGIDGTPLVPFDDSCKACVYGEVEWQDPCKSYGILVVIIDNSIRIDHCAHEAAHYAFEMCNAMGIAPDEHHQETFAYLVGYATKCIWKVLKNIKDK